MMHYISPARMVASYAVANIALLLVVITRPGLIGGSAIVITSFFKSVMYPTIFALGVKGLGSDTKLGGSLLVMAILGGALFPPLMGWIARVANNLVLSYAVPLVGYGCVAAYALFVPRFESRAVAR